MKATTMTHTFYLASMQIGDDFSYQVYPTDMSEYGYVTITTKDVEVEIEFPDNFDPVNGHIDALKERKKNIGAKAQVEINKIEEQIQSLLAIECDS